MIIDAHTHLSIYQKQASSLEDAVNKLLEKMRINGIDYAIIIPDNLEGGPQIADLDTARKLIKNQNNLFLLGSPQIIQRGSSEVDKYQKLLKEGVIKGLKLFPGHDPYNPMDERCFPFYVMLQESGYPVIIHTGDSSSDPNITQPLKYNDPKYIVEVARRYPRLKVVITHFYWPKIDYCYEVTKDIANIYFEIAALADQEVLDASGGIDKMRGVLLKVIQDRPDKIIFGTDYPMCDIKKHIEFIKSLQLQKGIEDKIFSLNAIDLYNLPI